MEVSKVVNTEQIRGTMQRRSVRIEALLGLLFAISAWACGRVLDPHEHGGSGGAGTAGQAASLGDALTVCPNPPPSGCATTCAQVQDILQTSCVQCHQKGPSSAPAIAPQFDFILDLDQLTHTPPSRTFPERAYVVPGDPDASLLYLRAARGQMPPPSSASVSVPTPSDLAVVREWISTCLGSTSGAEPDAGSPSSAGGTGGHDSNGIPEGSAVPCPESAPTGACTAAGLTCHYSAQTCNCDGGNWNCTNCPDTQPKVGDDCPAAPVVPGARDGTPDMSCRYAGVTCSCTQNSEASGWGCGLCPATKPSVDQGCGNTLFSCDYAGDRCTCLDSVWSCASQICSLHPVSGPVSCLGPIACAYPDEDQICSCSPFWNCSCPTAAPREDGECAGDPKCAYEDRQCECVSTHWHCSEACPKTQPRNGSTCTSSLTCNYSSGLCYCDGSAWVCSE